MNQIAHCFRTNRELEDHACDMLDIKSIMIAPSAHREGKNDIEIIRDHKEEIIEEGGSMDRGGLQFANLIPDERSRREIQCVGNGVGILGGIHGGRRRRSGFKVEIVMGVAFESPRG